MKSNRVLPLLWVAAALLGAWTLYRYVDFVGGKVRCRTPLGDREIRERLREKGGSPKARIAKNWPDYENTFEVDVTGVMHAPLTDEPGPPPPPPPPVAAVADLLRVIYVMFDAADATGTRAFNLQDFTGHFCFVQYKDPTLEKIAEPLLTVGDRLPDPHGNVQVRTVLPDRVVFLRGGDGEEEVRVCEYEVAGDLVGGVLMGGDAAASSPGPIRAPSSPGWPAATTEVRRHIFKVGTSDVEAWAARGNEIVGTEEIAVTPYYPKGASQPDGLRINSIRPGSISEGKGLKPGDIVRSINGTPVRSKEGVIEYAQSHPDLRSFTLEIDRLGLPLTLQYSLPR
ncbi:MAG TPA: PDZ domain-containing protein [Planctomycetota bacterium]|nr:PDZ domain-containing protein [Planctomycetota bacterium]